MIYGLTAAVGWGLADFFAAVGGRRMGSVATVVVGQAMSAVFMMIVLLASGSSIRPLSAILWVVALNGVCTAVAYASHYHALELGPVAVVSPIGAGYVVVGVALAVVFLGERPGPLALAGIAVVVAGAFLVSTNLDALRAGLRERPPGLPWAIVSAVGFGMAGFVLAYASKRVGWIPALWASRMAQLVCYTPLFVWRRADIGRLRRAGAFALGAALLAGATDIFGVTVYAAGAVHHDIAIVLASSAVFPLIAVAASVAYLRERLVRNQWAGVVCVVAGLVLLGLSAA
ncbi:MAG: EamA family transporter [Actinomycetota bacterium]